MPADPGGDRARHRVRRARRAAGADDGDAAARRAVQRRRRRRGRDRRARRVPVRRRGEPASVALAASVVHRPHRLGLVQRLGHHLPEAAGADDLPPGGLPGHAAAAAARRRRVRWAWRSASSVTTVDPADLRARGRSRCCSACCSCCRSAVPTSPSSSRCSTRSPVWPWRRPASCSTTCCCSIAGTLVGASGTLLTLLMAKAMGRPIGSTLFGALIGRVDARGRRGVRPPGEVARPVRRRGHARLRRAGGDRPRLRPGRGAGPGRAQGARRPARRARHRGRRTASTRWPVACRVT